MKLQLKILLPVLLTAALLLSACNAPSTNATPTDSVSAIYTAAVQTIEAQATLATKTSTPTPIITFTPTPPAPSATVAAPTTAPTSGGGQALCDNSVYVADVTIPDNTVVSPGQTFDKTWKLMNSGACAWTTSYSMVFAGGEKMGGNNTTLSQAVPSQAQGNVTVKLTAPTAPGTYTGYWRLANSQGAAFGQQVSVVIVVSGSAATATATTGAAVTATATNALPANTATATVPAPTVTGTATETKTP
jgi:hypothetical protein